MRIARGELIGVEAEVLRSPDPTMVGLRGHVVDETRNMLVLAREDGRVVRVAKEPNRFAFGPDAVALDGDIIRYRPEDRIKKVR